MADTMSTIGSPEDGADNTSKTATPNAATTEATPSTAPVTPNASEAPTSSGTTETKPDASKKTLTDEEKAASKKRQEEEDKQKEKRAQEIDDWRKHDFALLYAKTNKGWRAWEAITYDDSEERKKLLESGAGDSTAKLSSSATLALKDGWFKQVPPEKDDLHLRFKNGKVWPTNIIDKDNSEKAYSQAMDFCAGALGTNVIMIDFDEVGSSFYPGQRDQIKLMVRLAEKKRGGD